MKRFHIFPFWLLIYIGVLLFLYVLVFAKINTASDIFWYVGAYVLGIIILSSKILDLDKDYLKISYYGFFSKKYPYSKITRIVNGKDAQLRPEFRIHVEDKVILNLNIYEFGIHPTRNKEYVKKMILKRKV